MVLKRKQQVLEGKEHHYILINLFEFKENSNIMESLPLGLMKSDYFKIDAKIDFKKTLTKTEEDEYLPFPFVIDELEKVDFIKINSKRIGYLINEIENIYQSEFNTLEVNTEFDDNFKTSIDILRNITKSWSSESDFYILTIRNFENNNPKIHELYHDMNFIHDYFYFAIGLNEELNELIIVELGYE